jgi:hypothetical protein
MHSPRWLAAPLRSSAMLREIERRGFQDSIIFGPERLEMPMSWSQQRALYPASRLGVLRSPR